VRIGFCGCERCLLRGLVFVLLQSNVPRDAGRRRDRPELVDDVAWQEVDVVVAERDARVPNSLSEEQIKLALAKPDRALKRIKNYVK
jgi:hypothetical protein